VNEKFLDGANVVSAFEKVGGKTVSKRSEISGEEKEEEEEENAQRRMGGRGRI
jgi:hypothetical protein